MMRYILWATAAVLFLSGAAFLGEEIAPTPPPGVAGTGGYSTLECCPGPPPKCDPNPCPPEFGE